MLLPEPARPGPPSTNPIADLPGNRGTYIASLDEQEEVLGSVFFSPRCHPLVVDENFFCCIISFCTRKTSKDRQSRNEGYHFLIPEAFTVIL